jgi:hypothetical protein
LDSNLISQPDREHDSSTSSLNQSAPQETPSRSDIDDDDILPGLISQLLKEGHKVRFRAPGKSMRPAVLDGDVLIVEPVETAAIKIGDIILYQAEELMIAHRVKSIEKIEYRKNQPSKHSATTSLTKSGPGDRTINENLYVFLLRGDASFSYDEPVYADQILGKAITIERNGRAINPYSFSYRLTCRARTWASRLKRIYF